MSEQTKLPQFKDVKTSVSYPELEEQVLQLWRNRNVFQRSMSERWGGPEYVFYEGPPTANGRPGGINRRGSFGPYEADFLDNYEIGWKTEWADGRMRWNGAIYLENWRDFQFAFLGANLTRRGSRRAPDTFC